MAIVPMDLWSRWTNKTDRHDITEILLKVVLNTINHSVHSITVGYSWHYIRTILFSLRFTMIKWFSDFAFQNTGWLLLFVIWLLFLKPTQIPGRESMLSLSKIFNHEQVNSHDHDVLEYFQNQTVPIVYYNCTQNVQLQKGTGGLRNTYNNPLKYDCSHSRLNISRWVVNTSE